MDGDAAFRWTPEDGMRPVSDHGNNSEANAISDDGSVIAGQAWCDRSSWNGNGTLLWGQTSGLGDLRCEVREHLVDVSGNGRTTLGMNGSLSLDGGRPVSFRDVLTAGGFDPEGWVFYDFRAISADGLSIVCISNHPEGDVSSVVVRFDDEDENGVPDALQIANGETLDAPEIHFLRGDANGDGTRNLSDAINILLHLFAGNPTDCAKALDVDDTGTLEIADPITLLDHLFLGGPAIPAPSTTCGVDSREDGLTCQRPCAS